MGRKKRSFIDRKTAMVYELVHRPKEEETEQADSALYVLRRVGKEGADGDEVLDPEITHVDKEVLERDFDEYDAKTWDMLEYGFPDDGHDYSKHFQESGGGVFIPAIGFEDATINQLLQKEEEENLKKLQSERKKNRELDLVMAMLESDDDDEVDEEEDGEYHLENFDEQREGQSEDLDEFLPDDFVVLAGGEVDAKPQVEEDGFDSDDPIVRHAREQRLLDEQFDRLLLDEYEDSDLDDEFFDDEDEAKLEESAKADVKLIEGTLDEFLDNLQPVKLDDKGSTYARIDDLGTNLEDEVELEVFEVPDKHEQWDCETILSTYSNLDNHPKVIGMPTGSKKKQIILDRKLQAPVDYLPQRSASHANESQAKSSSVPSATEAKRGKNETAAERKERKQAVKAEKRERRASKKELRQAFRAENTRQGRTDAAIGTSKVAIQYS